MKNRYRSFIVAIIVIIISLHGCRGCRRDAPAISNLSYSPQTVTQGSGGGTVTLTGTFDFNDPSGNVETVTILTYNSSGQLIGTTSFPANATGVKVGRLTWDIDGMPTTTVTNYMFNIYVTDSTDLKSNMLTGTFSVTQNSVHVPLRKNK
jgi:hypothetical protein